MGLRTDAESPDTASSARPPEEHSILRTLGATLFAAGLVRTLLKPENRRNAGQGKAAFRANAFIRVVIPN
jgi:hypothetical protein